MQMSASGEEKHIALLHAVVWLTKEQPCRKGFEDFGEQADHEIVMQADGKGSQQPPRLH